MINITAPAIEVPNADAVGVVIVNAAKATGARPEDVASGVQRERQVVRARWYAAEVLRRLYPDLNKTSIGRLVGATSPGSYFTAYEFMRKTHKLEWWDDGVFVSVLKRSREQINSLEEVQ